MLFKEKQQSSYCGILSNAIKFNCQYFYFLSHLKDTLATSLPFPCSADKSSLLDHPTTDKGTCQGI